MPYRFCIASLCLALGACSFSPTKISSLDEDQRQQIAYTTLYNQQGRLDHAAYAAALERQGFRLAWEDFANGCNGSVADAQ